MPSLYWRFLSAAVAPLVLAPPCLAEEAEPVSVDSVIVTGTRDPEEPGVVADARQRLSETPGAVSVISQESFLKRQALGLDDMLRDAPGVYAQKKWGGDVRLSIRGSGLGNANHNRGLLIAQDGVPLNEADGFGDSQIADPLLTRYVEVYRGGNALPPSQGPPAVRGRPARQLHSSRRGVRTEHEELEQREREYRAGRRHEQNMVGEERSPTGSVTY